MSWGPNSGCVVLHQRPMKSLRYSGLEEVGPGGRPELAGGGGESAQQFESHFLLQALFGVLETPLVTGAPLQEAGAPA